jgi:branched-chain amino acid transport system ATP-binding protein
MLEAKGVRKHFGGVQALDGAGIEVREGEIVGLVGPNGSGKTTMLNVLSGFVEPDEGHVLLEGRPVQGMPSWDISKLGMRRTFQQPGMPERMTTREVMLCGAELETSSTIWGAMVRPGVVRRERNEALRRADELLETLQLSHVAELRAAQLSGGQQKLLSLGVVLMAEPKVLLLDEPTAGVNPTLRLGLVDALRRIRAEGVSLLIVEHDMAFIGALCDRVFVLDRGRDVVSCSPSELREHPEVVEAYLGKPREARGRQRRKEAAQ